MKRLLVFSLLTVLIAAACKTPASAPVKSPVNDLLSTALRNLQSDPICREVLARPEQYEVQILYTQINRDKSGHPQFTQFQYRFDSTHYFYPASTVKMPLALLALEKINRLHPSHQLLHRETPYRIDSLRPWQQVYETDPTAPGGKPSIAHDVRQIFVVSDNLAYNHLFEFLGREEINNSLRAKGYSRTGIVHRFNFPGRDNRFDSPITFYTPTVGIYKQGERMNRAEWPNLQQQLLKGTAHFNAADSLEARPMDFSSKNWFSLGDMEKMIRAIYFPESIPPAQRFNLTEDDYRFVRHYMGIYPRECDFPKYDSSYYDGYVKFFLYGDSKKPGADKVRVFNKVGEAYGTLSDAAYIVDFEKNVEFILCATILCNNDGTFNDDRYDYDKIGFPFLAKLGRAVYELECKRPKAVEPDLSRLYEVLK